MRVAPSRLAIAIAIAGTMLAMGCATSQPQIPELTVTAVDYGFQLPDTVAGGLVHVHFIDSGKEPHHAQFVRLNDGVTTAQFDSALSSTIEAAATEGEGAFDRLFQVASLAGGPAIIQPGGNEDVIVNLEPGNYRLFCFVTGPDGIPHLMKGMQHALVVTAPTEPQPATPVADAEVGLTDYTFTLPPFTAGSTLVAVTNHGQEAHEINIVRLKGISVDQFVSMISGPPQAGGPPPFEFVGGFQGIMPGQTGWAQLDLTPGDYVAVCFIPSTAHEGKPHFALGMVKGFTVS
jgi:hypothetical protein